MCGIVTLATSSQSSLQISSPKLSEIVHSLKHRGPDGSRIWISPNTQIGMGHARLSVLDLEGGWQPLVDSQTGCAICFNGEIYNYRELREELIKLGSRFLTNSDTEVLLHSY